MNIAEETQVFKRFFPHDAVDYCYKLWKTHNFQLRITKTRKTKLGDYRFDQESHFISVNHNLNPFAFLITYLHEVAHMQALVKHGRKIQPHGEQWKSEFKILMKPMLNIHVFPNDIQQALGNYMSNPKAASCSDMHLSLTLRSYDKPDGLIPLSKLETGSHFTLNSRQFEKLEVRRTRSLCKEIPSGKKYLVSEMAMVKISQE